MTKKRPSYPCPQLVPRKKKDMLKIVQNPEMMQKLIALNNAASAVLEKKEKTKALTIDEWLDRSFAILPEGYDTEELKTKIKDCFKKGNSDDSYNERQNCEHE